MEEYVGKQEAYEVKSECNDTKSEKKISILDQIGQIAPIFHKLIPFVNMIGVTDKEKFLYYCQGSELNTGNMIGREIPEGGTANEVLLSGEPVNAIVPKEIYGYAFKSFAMPVKGDNNELIGTVVLAISLETQNILIETTSTIVSSSQQLASASQEIASASEKIYNQFLDIQGIAKEVGTFIDKTDTILSFIHKIASNSKLLSLNAAIEAARAGEQGKGFSVISNEIYKMSTDSASSVKEIKGELESIKQGIERLTEKLNETVSVLQGQTYTTQEIADAAQQLATCAQDINKVAEII
jgi:hypothetical protein